MKILVTDLRSPIEEREAPDGFKRVEGMYVRVASGTGLISTGGLIPAAYCFPLENREQVETLMCQLRDERERHNNEVHAINMAAAELRGREGS